MKKTICFILLITTTGQLFCSDSLWTQFTNTLSSWKDSISSWVRQNPGKTTLAVGAAGIACYLYKQSCDEAKREQEIIEREKQLIGNSNPFKDKNKRSGGESNVILTSNDITAIKRNRDLQMQIDDLVTRRFHNTNPPHNGGFDYNSREGEKNLNYLLIVAQNLPGMQKLTDDINLIINRAKSRYNELLTDHESLSIQTKAQNLLNLISSLRNRPIKRVQFVLPNDARSLSKAEGKEEE